VFLSRRVSDRAVRSVVMTMVLVLSAVLIASIPAGGQAQLGPEQQQVLQDIIDARTAEVETAAEAPAGAGASVPGGTPAEATDEASKEAANGAAPAPETPESGAAPPAGSSQSDVEALATVLRDPELRQALIEVLRAADPAEAPAEPSANTEQTADKPQKPVMPGLAGLAAATLGAVSGGNGTSPSEGSEGDGGTTQDSSSGESKETTAPLPILAPEISVLTDLVHDLYENAVWASDIANQAPQVLDWLVLQFDDDIRGTWISLAWQIGLVVLAGVVAALLARFALRGAVRNLKGKATEATGGRRVAILVTRLLLSLLPILIFAVAAQASMPLIDADLRTELVAAAVITTVVLKRAVTLILRSLFSPKDTAARLVPVSDDAAYVLFRGLQRIAGTMVFGYLAVEVARLFGMPPGGRDLFVHVIGFIVLVFTVITLFSLRHAGKRVIRRVAVAGPASTFWVGGLLRILADIWHVLAAAYAAGIFFVWVVDSEQWFALAGWATVKTALVCLLTVIVFGWVQRLRDRAMMQLHTTNRFDRAARQRARRYVGILTSALRLVLLVGALLLVLESWHIGIVAWLSEGFGLRLVSMAFNIGIVFMISIALWEGVNYAIQRYLSSTDTQGNLVERGQRERTLLPLLRNVLTVFLVVVVALILLSELGIDIAPLLAGAGVVGLAIGFGSQKLVQDVISGVFNLLEDTVSVGDVVQVAGLAGVVEAMSIRSLRLRDLSGNLHTVPFSNVDTVTNMTKDFSYYLMNVGVAYRENTDHVTQVLKEIGAGMQDDADYGPSILEPLEVLGVDGFADSAVIIKARIKTKPIMQWWVGREFNRRMKMRFDELGIEIPFPHTTLYFGVDKDGNAPPAHLHVDRLAAMGRSAVDGPDVMTPDQATMRLDKGSHPETPPVSLPDPDGDGR